MKTVCKENTCVGCMLCAEICPVDAITVNDGMKAYNAVIDETKCISCNACFSKCQNNHAPSFSSALSWQQGWANDEAVRNRSTSGGIASALILKMLETGGVVCSCAFKDGNFSFLFCETKDELPHYAGSKYVKSNAFGVYKKIASLLRSGRKVLFVGLPCQVGALRMYLSPALQENLIAVDLICHGTPAPKTLDLYLQQYESSLDSSTTISFRQKHTFSVKTDSLKGLTGKTDEYMLGFLEGLYYTDNCYECKYAQRNRVGDITLGDSWGSELPQEERLKGVSLIGCTTEKGRDFLNQCDITLLDVDCELAFKHNGQLNRPSLKPKNREKFFNCIAKGKKFNSAVFSCLPKKCLKQKVKRVAFLLGLKK